MAFDLCFPYPVLLVALHLGRSIPIDINQLHAVVLEEFLLMCLGQGSWCVPNRGRCSYILDSCFFF